MKSALGASSTGPGILYSHYAHRHVAAKQCVAVHGLTCLIAGSLLVSQAASRQVFEASRLLFSRKHFLAKFPKLPAATGPFQAIAVVFDHALLRAFSQAAGWGRCPPAGRSPAVQPVYRRSGPPAERLPVQPSGSIISPTPS